MTKTSFLVSRLVPARENRDVGHGGGMIFALLRSLLLAVEIYRSKVIIALIVGYDLLAQRICPCCCKI